MARWASPKPAVRCPWRRTGGAADRCARERSRSRSAPAGRAWRPGRRWRHSTPTVVTLLWVASVYVARTSRVQPTGASAVAAAGRRRRAQPLSAPPRPGPGAVGAAGSRSPALEGAAGTGRRRGCCARPLERRRTRRSPRAVHRRPGTAAPPYPRRPANRRRARGRRRRRPSGRPAGRARAGPAAGARPKPAATPDGRGGATARGGGGSDRLGARRCRAPGGRERFAGGGRGLRRQGRHQGAEGVRKAAGGEDGGAFGECSSGHLPLPSAWNVASVGWTCSEVGSASGSRPCVLARTGRAVGDGGLGGQQCGGGAWGDARTRRDSGAGRCWWW